METINHEYHVSLEIAQLLEEVGFDWKCRGIYVLDSENDPEYVFSTANFTNTSKEIEGYIRLSAPTLDVAQRWLREVKNFKVYVQKQSTADHHYFGEYYFQINESPINLISYETYEEAQEAGIKKALEIILEKGE